MEGMTTVKKKLHISSTAGATTLFPFLPMNHLSCLSCGISVDEKVFFSVRDCGIPHVDA